MRRRSLTAAACLLLVSPVLLPAQAVPQDYQRVLDTLHRTGDYKDGVLKVNVPRNDLNVTVEGFPTPTPFGFGGWLAMTKAAGGQRVMMGDLVLLEQEVNPVISAMLDHGLAVTALHNHFFFEQPRIFYMHVMGSGTPADLATRVKPGLDLIGHVPLPQTDGAPPHVAAGRASQLDTTKLSAIAGHSGEQTGAVYKITVGRDDLKITDMGAPIGTRMGLNTWAAFTGTDRDAAVAGDVAMLENEVQPVLKALRANGLDVVAIHQHMLDTRPAIIFLHYWGRGPADKLAAGFRAALDQLGKPASAHPHGAKSTSGLPTGSRVHGLTSSLVTK